VRRRASLGPSAAAQLPAPAYVPLGGCYTLPPLFVTPRFVSAGRAILLANMPGLEANTSMMYAVMHTMTAVLRQNGMSPRRVPMVTKL